MGPGRDLTLSPCICNQTCICNPTRYRLKLRDPLKVLSHEMNVSSGVSEVNSIYISQKTLLASGYPNDPYILGPPFL